MGKQGLFLALSREIYPTEMTVVGATWRMTLKPILEMEFSTMVLDLANEAIR